MVDIVRRFSDLVAPVTVNDFTDTIAAKSGVWVSAAL